MIEPAVSLRLVVLRANNPDPVRAFYEALGLAFTPERHGEGPPHHSATLGGVVFELYPASSDATGTENVRLGFAVPDLAATMRALHDLGAQVVTSPKQTPWGTRAVVRDPDGRAVELYQGEVTPAP